MKNGILQKIPMNSLANTIETSKSQSLKTGKFSQFYSISFLAKIG